MKPILKIICCIILSGFISPAFSQFVFERHEIAVAPSKHQTILTGSFMGNKAADLAIVQKDRLIIYSLVDSTWTKKLDKEMRREVLFVDVANINGRDRLITFQRGKLKCLFPETAKERTLVNVAAEFSASDQSIVPRVTVTRDLNNDKLDDLVIPLPDGFLVYIQRDSGTFTDPIKIGPREPFLEKAPYRLKRSYGEIGWSAQTNSTYQKRVHKMDFDLDGRADLVFWNGDRFDIYLQNKDGLFDTTPRTQKPKAEIDYDGTYSVFFKTEKEKLRKILLSTSDLNGDRIPDLLVISLKGIVSRGSQNRRHLFSGARYLIHFGRSSASGVKFPAEPDTVINSGGLVAGMRLRDLGNRDSKDLMFTTFKLGLSSVFRIVSARKTPLNLKFYRLEKNVFPKKPNAKHKLTAAMDPFNDQKVSFFPFVLTGDLDGDKISELVTAKGRKEMLVFRGVAGPTLFSQKPQKIRIDIPIDEQYTRLVDLNRDGKKDILMHHTPSGGENRVVILISK